MKYKDLSLHYRRSFRAKPYCCICGILLNDYDDIIMLTRREGRFNKKYFVHEECLNEQEKEEKTKKGWKIME